MRGTRFQSRLLRHPRSVPLARVLSQQRGEKRERIMSINPALVNNTSWSVAGFENGNLGSYYAVPWIFKADNTVSARGLWCGY